MCVQTLLEQRTRQNTQECDAMASVVFNLGKEMQLRLLERSGQGLASSFGLSTVRHTRCRFFSVL